MLISRSTVLSGARSPSLPFEFGPVSVDLPLLLVLPFLLREQLIADQSSGDEPHRSADQSAYGGVTDSAADNGACACAQARADQTALLPNSERTRAAAQED